MKLRKRILRCIIFSLWFLHFIPVYSQTILETYSYAKLLYNSKNYEQAIIELERVNLFSDSLKKEIYSLSGECYVKLNDYIKAIESYEKIINLENNDSIKLEYHFKVISLHLKNDQPIYALVYLNYINTGNSEYFTRRKLFYKMIGYFRLGNYEESLQCIYPLSLYYPGFDTAYVSNIFRAVLKLKSVNIKKFGMMSTVLPGLGQIANGEYEDGLNSFLLNTGLITLFIVMADRLSFFDAFLALFTTVRRYYAGGIQNAKVTAKRKIELKKIQLMNELLDYLENETIKL